MYDFIEELIEFFSIRQVKLLTPTEFKKLSHNHTQLELFNALNSIGLKPQIIKRLFPAYKTHEVSIDEVYLINGCKVTIGLHNPYNSLLVIRVSGSKAILEQYYYNIKNSSQKLLLNHGIILETFFNQKDVNNSQLVISQYISPITDIPKTIRDTMRCIK
jgi:hypothetical protein